LRDDEELVLSTGTSLRGRKEWWGVGVKADVVAMRRELARAWIFMMERRWEISLVKS